MDGKNIADVTAAASSSFKNKSSLLKNLNSKNVTVAGGNDYRLFTCRNSCSTKILIQLF